MTTKAKLLSSLIVILAAFLVGFMPQWLQNRRQTSELQTARETISRLQLQTEIEGIRNLAARMLLQASRQNYGNAGELSTDFFNRVQQLTATSTDSAVHTTAADLLQLRDSITSSLAQGNPAVVPDLQTLLQRTIDIPDSVKH
jgi:hypothetical protein